MVNQHERRAFLRRLGRRNSARNRLLAGTIGWRRSCSLKLMAAFTKRTFPGLIAVFLTALPSASATPWFEAIESGNLEAVEKLLNAGADIEAQNDWNGTALAQSVWTGRTQLTKLLLDRGADPNTSGKYGNPLSLAIQKWDKKSIRLLLADPRTDADFRTRNGSSAMSLIKMGHDGVDQEIVEFLLKRGASINAVNRRGLTPLMRACWVGAENWITFLLQNGADIHAKNRDGETAYMKAAQRGRLGIMEELEKCGGKVAVFLNRGRETNPDLSPAQRWAMATGAILNQSNGDDHETLVPTSVTAADKLIAHDLLKDYWGGIASEVQLLEALSNLERSQANPNELAWDLCRYANVARWGVMAGYITEEKAWVGMLRVARRIQGTYRSWAEMAESYQNGRLHWLSKRLSIPPDLRKTHKEAAYVVALLLNDADPNSPWTKNEWNTALGKD